MKAIYHTLDRAKDQKRKLSKTKERNAYKHTRRLQYINYTEPEKKILLPFNNNKTKSTEPRKSIQS